jgi:hypothetical protein
LECVELAPAFGAATLNDNASKLDALQTLRVATMSIFSFVSVFRTIHTKPLTSPLQAAHKPPSSHLEAGEQRLLPRRDGAGHRDVEPALHGQRLELLTCLLPAGLD